MKTTKEEAMIEEEDKRLGTIDTPPIYKKIEELETRLERMTYDRAAALGKLTATELELEDLKAKLEEEKASHGTECVASDFWHGKLDIAKEALKEIRANAIVAKLELYPEEDACNGYRITKKALEKLDE